MATVEQLPNDDSQVWLERAYIEQVKSGVGRRPGAAYIRFDHTSGRYYQAWYEWQADDLDPNDVVTFVPELFVAPVPIWKDEKGRQKIKLDVESLQCWLTIGIPNTVNRFFFNRYEELRLGHEAAEEYMKKGPTTRLWVDWNGSTWRKFDARTFGMDLDGRTIGPDQVPGLEGVYMDKDLAENPHLNAAEIAALRNPQFYSSAVRKQAQRAAKTPSRLDSLVKRLKGKK